MAIWFGQKGKKKVRTRYSTCKMKIDWSSDFELLSEPSEYFSTLRLPRTYAPVHPQNTCTATLCFYDNVDPMRDVRYRWGGIVANSLKELVVQLYLILAMNKAPLGDVSLKQVEFMIKGSKLIKTSAVRHYVERECYL